MDGWMFLSSQYYENKILESMSERIYVLKNCWATIFAWRHNS